MCNRENILALEKKWKLLNSDSPRNTTIEKQHFKLNETVNENAKEKAACLMN